MNMENNKRQHNTEIINSVCNIILTTVVTLSSGFMVWWLYQMLPLLVYVD